MYMAVDQVCGFEPAHEQKIRFKTAMTGIGLVADTQWRGMSEQYVDEPPVPHFVDQEAGYKANYPPYHLKLRELVHSGVIPPCAAKSGDE